MFGRSAARAAAVAAGTAARAAAVGIGTGAVAACAGGGGVQVHPLRLTALVTAAVDVPELHADFVVVEAGQGLRLECLHQITACLPDAGQPPAPAS